MVALQVVRQEPDAALQGHESRAPGQVFQLRLRQASLGSFQEAPGVGFKQVDVEIDLAEILLVLLAVVGAEANRVAEVVDAQTRHGGVQVDDADDLVGSPVNEDIIELCVVVGDPQRQLSLPQSGKRHGAVRFPVEDKLDFLFHILGTVHFVGGQGGLKLGKPVLGIVEVHDGLVKGFRGIVMEQVLEPAEGPGGGLEKLRGCGLEAVGIFNEGSQPPDLAVLIRKEIPAVSGLHQAQGLPGGIPAGGDDLLP